MISCNPYLNFNGNCRTAIETYAAILGADIMAIMPHSEMPDPSQVPAEWQDLIMHACLKIGDTFLMASDSPPEHFQAAAGLSVSLQIDDPAEADRVYAALAEEGSTTMPIEETFWALRFGMLVDRFGTPWMINCPQPEADCG